MTVAARSERARARVTPAEVSPYVVAPDTETGATPPGEAVVGGKGKKLLELCGAGFPVPPLFCVTTRVLSELRRELGDALGRCMADLETLAPGDPDAGARIRAAAHSADALVRGAGLPASAAQAIGQAFDEHFDASARVAVRSSVVGEDATGASFAGQMDTHLNVRREELADAVLGCLASAYSERALSYRHARARLGERIEAGVVVQAMISARAAGVVFTANPTTGDRSEVVVSAGLGLGEGVVSGATQADTFYVTKADGTVRAREIATKTRRIVRGERDASGTREEPVPPELRDRPSLGEVELAELVALAVRAEDRAGRPQDVEFAIEPGGRLRLLQSRPITTLAEGRLSVFDNANIVESYPGISLPLTFSYVRRAYAETFREAARRFGVSAEALGREQGTFENLVGLADGRIYYNILNWYRLYQLAGFDRALPAWERAMGLDAPAEGSAAPAALGRARRLYIGANIARQLFARSRSAAAYLRDLRAARDELGSIDLDDLDAHRLVELLEDLMARLLAPYAVAVVNDFYAQQLYDLVGRALDRWRVGASEPGRGEALRNDLLAGDAQLESVRPLESLLDLAGEVKREPALASLFSSAASEDELLREIRERPDLAWFRGRLDEHLERYGDRTLHELKLETPTLRDDPAYALRMLRGYVSSSREVAPRDTASRREAAEAAVREGLRGRPVRRRALFQLVRYARDAIAHRESLRLARAQGFGIVKSLFRAIAGRLAEGGALAEPDDVFYLTLDEVKGAVRGHSIHQDLRALVALRKREYARYQRAEPPPRIVTRGVVRAVSSFSSAALGAERGGPGVFDDDGDMLFGQGCSQGVVSAPAAVVSDPEQATDARGKILVAPSTDPGWVFLMVTAAGLVVERGSLLSHTAIIGRELGVPTVVGVEAATSRVRDGDELEIDGAAGTVRIASARRDRANTPPEAEATGKRNDDRD